MITNGMKGWHSALPTTLSKEPDQGRVLPGLTYHTFQIYNDLDQSLRWSRVRRLPPLKASIFKKKMSNLSLLPFRFDVTLGLGHLLFKKVNSQ